MILSATPPDFENSAWLLELFEFELQNCSRVFCFEYQYFVFTVFFLSSAGLVCLDLSNVAYLTWPCVFRFACFLICLVQILFLQVASVGNILILLVA